MVIKFIEISNEKLDFALKEVAKYVRNNFADQSLINDLVVYFNPDYKLWECRLYYYERVRL